jgi:uncharacterized protein (DUF433 family)
VRHLLILVATILPLLAGWLKEHEIFSEYPYLETEDIGECLRFARGLGDGAGTARSAPA